MDATAIRKTYIRCLPAMLAIVALSWSTVTAIETQSLKSVVTIPLGDPGADDPNPQRRTAVATSLAIAADGDWIAAGGDQHTIRVFDARSGQLIHRMTGHEDWVRGLSLASDGQTLVSAASDCCCRTWNAETGELQSVTGHAGKPLRCTAFHPNGSQFAAAGFGCPAMIYNVSHNQAMKHLAGPATDYTSLQFSPDGKQLAAVSSDGYLRVWDVVLGELRYEVAADLRRLRAVAYSPDGQFIATGGDGQTVKMWQADTGAAKQELYVRPAKVFCIHFLNNEELAVGGTDNRVQIWRFDGPSLVKLLEGHTGTICALDSSANGSLLVSGSFDTTVRVWNLDRSPSKKTANLPTPAAR